MVVSMQTERARRPTAELTEHVFDASEPEGVFDCLKEAKRRILAGWWVRKDFPNFGHEDIVSAVVRASGDNTELAAVTFWCIKHYLVKVYRYYGSIQEWNDLYMTCKQDVIAFLDEVQSSCLD